ncbi:MAG: NifB/NifX family molybdenum-iron cluster-binding protein [Firmicutes bacterium]|nr:NifB/NifX family molybdenum-iron cluster-binding protein [Bacillota bacterium]
MLVAVSATGKDLDSYLDPRFGRCAYLLFIDPESLQCEAVPNPGYGAGGGSGIRAAQEVVNRGARVLITGQCGPNAFGVLAASGVRMFQAPGEPVRKVLELYGQGKLNEIKAPGPGRPGPPGRGFW